MRNLFTLFSLLLITSSAFSQTDAKVDAVYTLAKIPAPLGVYRHTVQARISNPGTIAFSDLPVSLSVTGANLFSDTTLVSLDAGGSEVISFSVFSPWNPGSNLMTVSVPADANNTNNSAAYTQIVNNNTFGYADASPVVSSIGFGTNDGILLTRYEVSGSAVVKQVKAYISNSTTNIGRTVSGVVTEYGMIIGQSSPHVITASDLNTYFTFDIIDPPSVSAEFFVGLLQTSDGVSEYFPLAYQDEGSTTRPNAYFASLIDGSGMTSLDFIGRLMIEAVIDIGSVTPFNSSAASTASRSIIAWDFSGITSSATMPATTFDTSLSSSSLLTRGPGAPSSTGTHSFRTTGFGDNGIAVTNTDYFQLTLSPKPGDTLSLSSINGLLQGNSELIPVSGINSQFAYSLNGTDFTLIGSPFVTSGKVESFFVDVSSIPQLQNIVTGTTVTMRYYASGAGAVGDWGFISLQPGGNGLSINGRLVSPNKILTAPVIPNGADYTLADCNALATGSISFISTGNFSPTNKYKLVLGEVFQPQSNSYFFRDTVTIATLASNANSGVINFTLPPGTRQNNAYALRIISTEPYVSGSLSQTFTVNNSNNCISHRRDIFRSRASGNWTNLSTWETSNGTSWSPATLIPDDVASLIEIRRGDTVTVSTNVNVTNVLVKGTLRLLNDASNKGLISFNNPAFLQSSTMRIDTSGVFQLVSASHKFDDAVLFLTGRIRVFGKILIGDGTSTVATGFEKFATIPDNTVWFNGAVFEWNASTSFPTNGTTFFENSFGAPTFRLSKIETAALGGSDNTVLNSLLEVNTPVTWTGAGTKTFRDGIKGSSVLTQGAGSGQLIITSPFEDIPASSSSNATMQGIIGGTARINLGTAGLTMLEGITIPATANVVISGGSLALQNVELQPNARLQLEAGSIFNIENGGLLNQGILNGPGTVKFTGPATSLLTSPGVLTAPLVLDNKQLELGGNSNTDSINLSNLSNITLNNFNLTMGAANLVSDESNFIVTNDTGRLSRVVAAVPVIFPVGINNASYTPVTLANSGSPANLKAGVSPGVQSDIPILTGHVDRTWNIGDTSQTGINLSITTQWKAAEEQPDFDRTRCYISQYITCTPGPGCTPYFDAVAAANSTGTTLFSIQRSEGITDFRSPAFVVTSKPSIYTFTGNGDWNNSANWTPAIVAPTVIPPGVEVHIDPAGTGECLQNGNITIKPGGILKVQPGKRLRVTGNLTTE